MNEGVTHKNSDTGKYIVCPPFPAKTARQIETTSHAANQFSNEMQWNPDPFSLQGTFKITDVVHIMALSHLTTLVVP